MSTVLIVDDQEIVRTTLQKEFSRVGLQVRDTGIADDAYEILWKETPDVVIIDYEMVPRGDVILGVMHTFRPDLPIVSFSSTVAADEELAKRLLSEGAARVCPKPNARRLVQAVLEILGETH